MKKQSLVDCFFILVVERDLCLCPTGYADERSSLWERGKNATGWRFWRSDTPKRREFAKQSVIATIA